MSNVIDFKEAKEKLKKETKTSRPNIPSQEGSIEEVKAAFEKVRLKNAEDKKRIEEERRQYNNQTKKQFNLEGK